MYKVCGHDCEITPPFQLTEDREEQNDALNGQLERLKQKSLLFNAPCNDSNVGYDEHSSSIHVCSILQNSLHQFIQNISQYVRNVYCSIIV